ncbi:hypothetical protein QYM36_002147 [Artemia franciscana]|uniref:Uncharacterized protein n=1 Tax=Artemia franciscana TaxID=6661 RepID=A0AA88LEN8_ARTSF|nr:hypothetical protein QYM36_002147 [Artemia franciscana]
MGYKITNIITILVKLFEVILFRHKDALSLLDDNDLCDLEDSEDEESKTTRSVLFVSAQAEMLSDTGEEPFIEN